MENEVIHEWSMCQNLKSGLLVCFAMMTLYCIGGHFDSGHPYIESPTTLSDIYSDIETILTMLTT